LERRQRHYAVLAIVFVGSFASAALLHRYTAVAVVLCVVAMVTLVLAVIGANVRSPRRPDGPHRVSSERRQLRSAKRRPTK
jgi:hypothetical protein